MAGTGIEDIGIGSRQTPDGSWRQSGTFQVEIGRRGLTTTRVDGGGVTFKKGARLAVGFLNDGKRVGSWDVMTWDGELTGRDHLTLANTVDTDTWNFYFVDTDELRRAVLRGSGAIDGSPENIHKKAKNSKPETREGINRYKNVILNTYRRDLGAYPNTVRRISNGDVEELPGVHKR